MRVPTLFLILLTAFAATNIYASPSLTPQSFGEVSKLVAPDGAQYDFFGNDVAINGDTIVIGAYEDDVGPNILQGSAYVFVRSGNSWTFQQKLTASDAVPHDEFGVSVAIEGDTIIIGAPYKWVGANHEQGLAYIYHRNNGVWTEQQRITPSDGIYGGSFGWDVGLSGNTAVFGNPARTLGDGNPGSVYVFTKIGDTWVQQQKLTASDGEDDGEFGSAVAVSGNSLISGMPQDTIGGHDGQGSAYVFTRNGTLWSQQQKVVAPDGGRLNYFGNDVALSGDTVLIGARQHDLCPNLEQGAAYVFSRIGNIWILEQKLYASDGGAQDSFGDLALSGNTALIGARLADVSGNRNQGSAYLYTRTGSQWTQIQKYTASDGLAGAALGSSVAIDSGTAIIGSYTAAVNGNEAQGAAYIIAEGFPTPDPSPTPTATNTPAPSPTMTPFEPVTVYIGADFGLSFSVDGWNYTSYQTFTWVPGSTHSIGTASPQNVNAGSRDVWNKWNDCRERQHSITAFGGGYWAEFDHEFLLTTETSPTSGGTLTQHPTTSDGYYNAETSVVLTAIANSGYVFIGWVGSGPGSYTGPNNPVAINMNGPITETAFFAPEPVITGTVTYGNAIGAPMPRSVSNVMLIGSGLPNISTLTWADGTYTLSGFGSGAYTVTPSKTGEANGISSFDSARVAQHAAGVNPLTGNQMIVADVSGNGGVSSFDAAQIARYAAGLNNTGSTGNWLFMPANRTYASVTTNITGEDFIALLMGDVSGNWMPTSPNHLR